MKKIFKQWQPVGLSLLIVSIIIGIGALFYVSARDQMESQIHERLRSIAAAAAVNVDGDMIDRINGPVDSAGSEYRDLIAMLDQLRQLPHIRFAYVLKKTDQPLVLSFVADADAALTPEQLDANQNGAVDEDEEPAYPGDLYDVTDIPALQKDAFLQPVTDAAITHDQWGALISGYAPVRRADGSVSGVLGIDMNADDYLRLSQSIFSPAAFLLVFFDALFVGAFILFLWNRRQIGMLTRINNERSGLLRLTFHQLGEPLTIMKWSLETLREETDNPELRTLVEEHVVCMDEGLGRLNSIIDTLQLAEKVDLHTLQYLPVPASLRALIDNAVNEWKTSMEKRNQHLHVFMEDDVRMPLDSTLLSIVFRQIIMNAMEYSADGSDISLRVEPGRTHVRIAVEDQGCGIPGKDMEHLFEKYRRASNAHLKKPDGNGLGLYIAQGIVEKAGGTIRIASEQDKGTTVTVTLPLA